MRKLYSVFDKKTETFADPVTSTNDATIIRDFAAAVMQEDHNFHKFAEDYQLWKLAEFCNQTGCVYPEAVLITSADEILRKNPQHVGQVLEHMKRAEEK